MLEATLDELIETGYAGLTIQGVADRAGVNKTSLYRRWGTKARLLADALLSGSAEAPIPESTGDITRDLLALSATGPAPRDRDGARTIAVHRALVAAANDPDVAEAHRALWDRRLRLTTRIVEEAVSRGALPPGADPELLMDLLFGPYYIRVIARGLAPTREFLAAVMDVALESVASDAKRRLSSQPRRSGRRAQGA